MRELEGRHPAAAVRDSRAGGDRREDHRPRDGEGGAQRRPRQVLRGGHHAKKEAPREAEGGQEADAQDRHRRGPLRGIHADLKDQQG